MKAVVLAVAWVAVSGWNGTTVESAAGELLFHGMCDASAAVALDERRFAVANDEDNLLRIYDRLNAGKPVGGLDVSAHLHIENGREADIEGAARIGDTIYWISSHGRNKNAKLRPERYRLFATKIVQGGANPALRVIGESRDDLLHHLLMDERCERFGFAKASLKAPKARDGFNIEALASTPDGRLLIGFRNPLFERKAIVIPLKNPSAYIDGREPVLEEPMLIDLGGQGVRCIESVAEGYLVVAGDHDGGGVFRLFRWSGREGGLLEMDAGWMDDFRPEAVAVFGGKDDREWLFLSDDGTRAIGGTDCKEVEPPSRRRFRGRYLDY